MRLKLFFVAALLLSAPFNTLLATTNVFSYPQAFQAHKELVLAFRQNAQHHDLAGMERTCRSGVALLPDDPVWYYNLACSLALERHSHESLCALEQAVELGFRNSDLIARDSDLASLRDLPEFAIILTKARTMPKTEIIPSPVSNGVAWVSTSNTWWDFDAGCFHSFFTIPTNPPTAALLASQWNGPEAAVIRSWMASNTAAGNIGDYYDNRDAGHSLIKTDPFAGMSAIRYAPEACAEKVHFALSSFLFNGVVIGNSSTAWTIGPIWRSLPRAAMLDGNAVILQCMQYLGNHLYVYPSHHDYDIKGLGDLYPVNQPYVVISHGSSFTDQPFLLAFGATLAAFQPDTKLFMAKRGLIAPTLQMLLRASQKTVHVSEDYLTPRAHPTVFDGASLDVARMVRMAHDLTPHDIPPIVTLRTLKDHLAVPGVDFFDLANSDALYDSPCVIARVIRSMNYRKTIEVGATVSGIPNQTNEWKLHWVVLRGLPGRVVVLPLSPDSSRVEISVAYHGGHFPIEMGEALQSSRVDIGVIASNGRLFSSPSFISFSFLDNELRTYADDGRILSTDYDAASTNRYVDPMLSLSKHWRDDYTYNAEKCLVGWTRHHREGKVDRFTPLGERIETIDTLGRPITTRVVSYVPRATAPNDFSLSDLVQTDSDVRVTYRYASDADPTGEVVSRTRMSPKSD